MVVLGPVVAIPSELERAFVIVDHALPTQEQLGQIAVDVLADHPDGLPTDRAWQSLLEAAAGLARAEISAHRGCVYFVYKTQSVENSAPQPQSALRVHDMSAVTVLRGLREQIVTELRSELLSGRLAPGEPMREESLAERFGVSRVPIRQVLHELVHEGLLVAKRNCGVRVADVPKSQVCELLSPLRAQIEIYALRLAYERLKSDDFASFDPILARLRFACEQQDGPAILDLDFEFHRHLLESAELQDVIPIWQSVICRMRDFHSAGNKSLEDLLYVHFVHEALIETFRAKGIEAGVVALTEHLFNGKFNKDMLTRFRRQKTLKRKSR